MTQDLLEKLIAQEDILLIDDIYDQDIPVLSIRSFIEETFGRTHGVDEGICI